MTINTPAVIAIGLLVAFLLFLAWRRPRPDFGPLAEQEAKRERNLHARENLRRYIQICRGILKKENGLGAVITPRPARPSNGSPRWSRPARRRLVRVMKKRGLVAPA